jgi:hypothetical protein
MGLNVLLIEGSAGKNSFRKYEKTVPERTGNSKLKIDIAVTLPIS